MSQLYRIVKIYLYIFANLILNNEYLLHLTNCKSNLKLSIKFHCMITISQISSSNYKYNIKTLKIIIANTFTINFSYTKILPSKENF